MNLAPRTHGRKISIYSVQSKRGKIGPMKNIKLHLSMLCGDQDHLRSFQYVIPIHIIIATLQISFPFMLQSWVIINYKTPIQNTVYGRNYSLGRSDQCAEHVIFQGRLTRNRWEILVNFSNPMSDLEIFEKIMIRQFVLGRQLLKIRKSVVTIQLIDSPDSAIKPTL